MDIDYIVVPSANNNLAAIQADIISGIAFLEKAEKAFDAGDLTTAERLLDSAGQLDADVLRQVGLLTEAESDEIAITLAPFENRLYHVAVLLGVLTRR
jgi:hypothetical protein